MALIGAFKKNGPNGFGYETTAEQATEGKDLTGQVVLITGVNSGLGYESARVLSARGAKIIGLARTKEKADNALKSIGAEGFGVACELSEPELVLKAVEDVKALGLKLDVIMANAGIMALPKLTLHHGYELQFLTNHIGHFILTTGLLDILTDDGRVVILSSTAHTRTVKGGINFDNLDGSQGYNDWEFYGQSKLSNLLFAKELNKRLPGNQVAYSVHPGVIPTNLGRHLPGFMQTIFGWVTPLFFKTIPQGSATQCYVAVSDDARAHAGAYFADSNPAKTSYYGTDDELAAKLWVETEKIVAGLTAKASVA